ESAIRLLDAGLRKVSTMLDGELKRDFFPDLPFSPLRHELKEGFRFFVKRKAAINAVELDHLPEVKQFSSSDCVGASFMGAFSGFTGIEPTRDLYGEVLQTAVKRGFAQHEGPGIKVEPFIFNVFSTPEFRNALGDITVAYRKKLSLPEISKIVKTGHNKNYAVYAFLPFASWINPGGGHMVTLRNIGESQTTVFDPRLGDNRTLPNAEFQERWNHDQKSAVLIFKKQKST
ncbi:MAG: hypothetical protein ACM3IJ_05815, partial [Candidatus Levyibacteriota bacterium]